MKKRQRRGTRFSDDGLTVFVNLRVNRRFYEFARFWANAHAVADPAGTAEDQLEGYLNTAISSAIAAAEWEAPAEIEALYGPALPPKVVRWKGLKMVVPSEFRDTEIKTPEQAAEYVSDIIGFMAIPRTRESLHKAQKKGWVRIARFYEQMLLVLKEWYAEDVETDLSKDDE
jgi:hypothetical protein